MKRQKEQYRHPVRIDNNKEGSDLIPKHIYYCWFGGKPLPKSVKKCIASWKKHCPDYKITEINESNFDLDAHPYTACMYKKKKYAFVSDYARLKIIFEQGGIYLDTDVEIIKNLDPLIKYRCYFGFEYKSAVASGLGFGCEKGHPVLKSMMDSYDELVRKQDKPLPVICTQINTDAFIPYGLILNGKTQYFNNNEIAVFSKDYFNPSKTNGLVNVTENTYSVHWFDASWQTPSMKFRIRLGKYFLKVFGTSPSVWLRNRFKFTNKKN